MATVFERKLHTTMLISSVFAIALLIPTAVEYSNRYRYWYQESAGSSPFAFIPLGFSIITSAFYVIQQLRSKKTGVEVKARPLPWVAAHFLIFGGYLTALMFIWLRDPDHLEYQPRIAMLEAYATVPLILNMLIHAGLFFYNVYKARATIFAWLKGLEADECPHCHHKIGTHAKGSAKETTTREGYSLLRGEDYDDDAGRASEDNAAVGTVLDV